MGEYVEANYDGVAPHKRLLTRTKKKKEFLKQMNTSEVWICPVNSLEKNYNTCDNTVNTCDFLKIYLTEHYNVVTIARLLWIDFVKHLIMSFMMLI